MGEDGQRVHLVSLRSNPSNREGRVKNPPDVLRRILRSGGQHLPGAQYLFDAESLFLQHH
jgi:hypothetical protein